MATTSKLPGTRQPREKSLINDHLSRMVTLKRTFSAMSRLTSEELLETYRDADDAAKAYGIVKDMCREEMQKRIENGRHVRGSTEKAVLIEAEKREYSVRKTLQQIKKFNLNIDAILSVSNSALNKLPTKVQEAIPFVSSKTEKLYLKPRDWTPAKTSTAKIRE